MSVSPPHPGSVVAGPGVVAWRNAVFAIFALNGFGIATWVSRTPGIREGLGIDTLQMGLLIFGLSAGSILGLVTSSAVLARLGARRAITIGMSGCGAALVVLGLGVDAAANPALAAAGMVVFGYGTGLTDVAMNLEGTHVERLGGRTLLPLFHATWSIGTIAGAGLGSLIVLLGVPVLPHLAAVGVLVVIGVVIAVRFLGEAPVEAPHATPEVARGGMAAALRRTIAVFDLRTVLIGLVALGMAFAEGTANDWLALAFVDERGVDEAGGAALFAIFTAAMTIGRIAGGPLVDRLGRVTVLRVSAALGAAGLLLVILVPALSASIVGILLWGFGASLGFPLAISAASDDPRGAAVRVSAVATVGYCAFLVGPPVIGVIGHDLGLFPTFLGVVALIVLAGVLAGGTRPPAATAASAPEKSSRRVA